MLCRNCGNKIENTADNCPYCGRKNVTCSGESKGFGSMKRNLLNVIGTAIFMIIVGFSIYYFESADKSLGVIGETGKEASAFLLKGRFLLLSGLVLVVILIIANIKENKK